MTYYRRIELSFSELFALSVYVDSFYGVPVLESDLGEFARFLHRSRGFDVELVARCVVESLLQVDVYHG